MSEVSHDSETPAVGQQVFSVCGFIHKKEGGVDKLFLGKRADTKKFLPGMWEFPGGHVDFGEDMVPGLKREVKEEFNMTLSVGDPFYVFTYKNLIKGSHTIEVIYFAAFTSPESDIKTNPADHSTYGWFTKEELIARASEMRANVADVPHDYHDDPEYMAMLRGFELLEKCNLNFGV